MNHKIIIVSIGLLASFTACKNPSTTGTADYRTLVVRREDRTLQTEYSASLKGRQTVEIRPQVSGFITKIGFGEGQKVRKGQVLFIIEQERYKAALDQAAANVESAEAKLATAELNLESARLLRQADVIQDYDVRTAGNALLASKAELAQAKAQMESAKIDYEHTMVVSPVDGVSGMIPYRVGDYVGSGIADPLTVVSDDSIVQAYFSMTEGDVINLLEKYSSLENFIREMPDVSLRMSNGKEYGVTGRIAAVSGIVTSGTGAVTLRADFRNAAGLLRGGGSATVIVPESHKDCIVIPKGATYELQDKVFVYKVVDRKAQSTPVRVHRLDNGTEYIVEDGLEEGDVIIAEGAGLLREGTVVVSSRNQ
ncbi:MAG: efflux RND transporter periplasmic adaptor subunit [Candidatus Cryptobacteroides sp.]